MTSTAARLPDTGSDATAELWRLLRPEFLARVGWDPEVGVLVARRDDPLLGLRQCAVTDCQASTTGWTKLCAACLRRHRASGIPLEQFVIAPSDKTVRGERLCRVQGCPRSARMRERLCGTHGWQRKRHPDLELQAWLARPEVVALSSYGACRVQACIRRADDQAGLCKPHVQRWHLHRADDPEADLDRWCRHAVPVALGHVTVLKGLPELMQAELLLGLQRRADAGLVTRPTSLRYLVKLAHARRARSVFDLAEVRSTSIRSDAGAVLRSLLNELRCATSDPERERAKDI